MRYHGGSPSQTNVAPALLNEQSQALSACGMNSFGQIGQCTTLVVRVSYFGTIFFCVSNLLVSAIPIT